jgi:serine/threonine-protein kinase RsbW
MRMMMTLWLPRDARSVAVARQSLDSVLAAFGVRTDCRQEIAIAVSEACSNAVQHATGEPTYELRVEVDGSECVITVNDNGPHAAVVVPRAMPQPTATAGRGIAIMNMTMDRVDFRPGPTGGLSTRLYKGLLWNEGAFGRPTEMRSFEAPGSTGGGGAMSPT